MVDPEQTTYASEARKAAPTLVAFAVGEGNQLSGATIPWLSEALFAAAALFGVFWLWPHLKRWNKRWHLQWPLARTAPIVASVGQAPLPPAPRVYSRADREALSDLYGDIIRVLAPHGGRSDGQGFCFKATAMGQEWIAQNISFHRGGDIDFTEVQEIERSATEDLNALRAALYGDAGICTDKRFLLYENEIWSILQDSGRKRITEMASLLTNFGRSVSGLYRFGPGPRAHTARMAEGMRTQADQLLKQVEAFQRWLIDATQRAEKRRDAISE